ncbi:hypothetical protein TI05_13835 [Achromatium sp. WMS3]|nr:hypothetical protein TI05_13835 [Achromatium sp. WMS3]
MALHAKQCEISEEEYIQGELVSEIRHEYLSGDVHAMVGTSDRHNLIVGNLFSALRPQVRGSGCQLFMADMKVRLEMANSVIFYYPDLFLACDPEDRATYYRTRPCLIVEVLSKSTERIDRREKLFAYMSIDSLQSYLLLSQDKIQAELRCRVDDWKMRLFTTGEVPIACLNTAVPLDIIYEEIDLSARDN